MKGFKENLSSFWAPFELILLREPMNQLLSYSPTVTGTVITAEIIFNYYTATAI